MTASPLAIGGLVDAVDKVHPARLWPDGTFTYVDIASVDQASKEIVRPQRVNSNEAPSRARQLVCAGDVLVSTVRPNLNAVALVPRRLDGAVASTGFAVLRPRAGVVDSRYLFHWVRSPSFIGDMTRRATGASYPAVSDRVVKGSELPLPPIEEQRRVAAILDQADELQAKRGASIDLMDCLSESIFLDMFGDPVTNPFGWPDDEVLAEVADIASGITKGRTVKSSAVRRVPYLAVANVQAGHLRLDEIKVIEATEQEINRYKLVPGDLVLTEGGDPDKLGRGTVWNGEIEECIHQNHIFRVRVVDAELEPVFVSTLLASKRGRRYFLGAAKQTTGIASINTTQLKAFPILRPPRELQEAFIARLQRRAELSSKLERHATKLQTLFSSLQRRAFAGEL